MSARPRPVTATVTMPEWMKAEYAYRPRQASLDSTGSTESLISCLDHDSYESGADDEEEAFRVKDSSRMPEEMAEISHISVKSERDPEGYCEKTEMTRKIAARDVEEESRLSPWEKWLVQKAQDDRLRKLEITRKKKEEKQKKDELEQEKMAKLQKADLKLREWLDKKDYEENLKYKLQKQRTHAEQEVKEMKKKEVQEKSDRKFQEWSVNKKQEERQKKKAERLKRAEVEEKQKERREVAEKKFEEWCKRVERPHPRSARNSFGYTCGKMTSYHDSGAYPAPTFCNPIPWQPIHVARQPDERKQLKPKKKKYAWNPNKYF